MSLLYSVPPIRLKAVAGADWVINIVGFGALTPYAGWASTGVPITPAGAWMAIAFGFLFAALYPLTQLYQFDEDASRGDRTLALVIGIDGSLRAALVATLLAFWSFARAAIPGTSPIGWGVLGLALVAWLAVLVPWARGWRGMDSSAHKRGMYKALGAWALTDAAVVAAFGL
jgi:1,4-dihydroxy-2-naphthoate octaprenyltransferase